jgi:glutathione S-transferase
MKLFYAPGACSLSPHIVLRELGLPFEIEAVDLKTKKTSSGADFAAINPKGYVPALQLDTGEVLTEGVAIVQYLVDKHAPGTLAPPAGTIERARLNGHLNFISAELHKAFGPLFNPAIAPEAREAAVANIGRKLDVIDRELADGRPYLTGPSFTVADAYLWVVLSWAQPLKVDLARWPRLGEFSRRVSARAAVQAATAAEGLQKAA